MSEPLPPQSSLKGPIIYALFVLSLFCLLALESSFKWQLGTTIFAGLVLCLGARWLGRKGTYKFRIGGLLSACLAIIMLFAVLYSLIFWNVSGSFRLSNELLTENVRDEYQQYSGRFLDLSREHYYLTLMRAQPSVVYDLIRAGDVEDAVLAKPIGTREVLEYSHSVIVMQGASDKDPVYINETYTLRITDAENKSLLYQFPDVTNTGVEIVHLGKTGLVSALVTAKSEDAVVKALENLVSANERERNESQAAMNRIVTMQPNLEMTHFIYFSAAIMTTVGSNDISPNNQATRMFVVLQSLVAVFFFGYALHFLWPEKMQDAG